MYAQVEELIRDVREVQGAGLSDAEALQQVGPLAERAVVEALVDPHE